MALILCIGNELVADDGVGHAVHAELSRRELPEGTRLELLGLGGLALLSELDGDPLLIVVDAVQLGGTPGTLRVMGWEELPTGNSPVSCHGIGIREAITVARKLYPETAPAEVYLVGIEGRCFDVLGQGLSPEVASSIGAAADRVFTLIASRNR